MIRSLFHRSGVILMALVMAGCSFASTADETPGPSVSTATPLLPAGASSEAPFIQPYVPDASSAATESPSVPREVEPPADLLPTASAIADEVNRLRVAIGIEPLAIDDGLTRIAFARSADMVMRGYLSHEDPSDGSNLPYLLLTDAGYRGLLGENIFASQAELGDLVDEAVDGWLRSPEQRAAAMDPTFHFTGVGVMSDGEWWKVTQVYAEELP
jgi:uncharacterized protein YkwD